MRIFTNLFVTLSIIFGGIFLSAPLAGAQNTGEIIKGINTTGTCTGDCATGAGVQKTITNVVNLFSLIVGIVAVIMIIVAGLMFITAGGDSGKVANARNTILYAAVGLVVVALAQTIVRFVLNKATQ